MQTIILNKPIPRVERPLTRLFLNGKRLRQGQVLKILEKHGYKITRRQIICDCLPRNYKGIQVRFKSFGSIIYPVDPKKYGELFHLMIDDGFFYRKCELPEDI